MFFSDAGAAQTKKREAKRRRRGLSRGMTRAPGKKVCESFRSGNKMVIFDEVLLCFGLEKEKTSFLERTPLV